MKALDALSVLRSGNDGVGEQWVPARESSNVSTEMSSQTWCKSEPQDHRKTTAKCDDSVNSVKLVTVRTSSSDKFTERLLYYEKAELCNDYSATSGQIRWGVARNHVIQIKAPRTNAGVKYRSSDLSY